MIQWFAFRDTFDVSLLTEFEVFFRQPGAIFSRAQLLHLFFSAKFSRSQYAIVARVHAEKHQVTHPVERLWMKAEIVHVQRLFDSQFDSLDRAQLVESNINAPQ